MIEYSGIALLYTRTCPLACRHCIISSSPQAQGKMLPELAQTLVDQAQALTNAVCFTGGEPMLYYNEVVPLIRRAAAHGMRTSLVTGAGWVSQTRPEIARSRIRGLAEAGLHTLYVSWDVYHEEYSRPDNALLLIEEARALALSVEVRGVMPANGAVPAIEQKLVQIDQLYHKVKLIRLGHAVQLPPSHFQSAPEVERGGCPIVLEPVVEPDGQVYACCGPSRGSSAGSPLILGNVFEESLTSILTRALEDPLLEAIYRVGPAGLQRFIRRDPELSTLLPARDSYTGVCELCLDICEAPKLVERLRVRLAHRDGRALIAASRLLQNRPTSAKEIYA